MKKKIIILIALVAVPLCISLSSCSSDSAPNPDEETPLPPVQQDNVIVTTLAGSGIVGNADGIGREAQFNGPYGITVDVVSGNLYVAETNNRCIRKITSEGVVTTLAGGIGGYADGIGSEAKFDYPHGITIDASGNLYVADFGNNCIRKVTLAGVVTTFVGSDTGGYADGKGNAAEFYNPCGIAVDTSGNLYVADTGNHCIRKVTPAGVVTTLAGNGTLGGADGKGSAAKFYRPSDIAIDVTGNLYVTDTYNHCIRKITPVGVVTTLAGSGGWGYADGKGKAAQFGAPTGITIDASGNLYVTDTYNSCIRKVTPAGVVTTLAGDGTLGDADGVGSVAKFDTPRGITIDASGNLYVAQGNNCIRKIVFK